jgi:hypothetical protein
MSALVHLVDLDSRATRPRHRRAGPVRSLCFSDALLELVAGFLRRGTSRLHRAVHLLALHVERVSSRIDLIFNATGGTVTTANIQDGSNVSWLSNTTISLLNLLRSSTLSKVGDLRSMVINHASIDATCVVNDPNSSMTWSYPVTVNGQVQSAWYLTGSGRTWLVV